MPKYYSWEAVVPNRDVVHAVSVIERDDSLIARLTQPEPSPLDYQTGDRNSATFCGVRIGQGIQVHGGVINLPTIRNHARLRTKAELANHRRCINCKKSLWAKQRGRSVGYWVWSGRQIEDWHEWPHERPPYPEEPVFVQAPAPAPWPTYYRYSVNAATTTTGVTFIVQNSNAWLPAGTTFTGNNAVPNSFVWDNSIYGFDMHGYTGQQPYADHVRNEAAHDQQVVVANNRRQEQAEWIGRIRHLADGPSDADEDLVLMDMNAIALVHDVIGIEALRQLAAEGHVDIASVSDPIKGYRLRPWRRVGILHLDTQAGWVELPKSLCAHPDETFPPGDELVALWLELTFNEADFLRRANLHQSWADADGTYSPTVDGTPYPAVLARQFLAAAV